MDDATVLSDPWIPKEGSLYNVLFLMVHNLCINFSPVKPAMIRHTKKVFNNFPRSVTKAVYHRHGDKHDYYCVDLIGYVTL